MLARSRTPYLLLLFALASVRAGIDVLPPAPLPATHEAGQILTPHGEELPFLFTGTGDEEASCDVEETVPAAIDTPRPEEVPSERMRPIVPEVSGPAALAFYPDNEELVNPFGRHTRLACEGLMQWLAPRGDGTRWHSGLDLVPLRGRAMGRKLYAPGDGFVLKAVDGHPQWGSYLLAVFRKGEKLYLTGWFHMKWRSHSHLEVRDSARGRTGLIHRGELLGRVGSTGASRGAHLHLDVVELPTAVTPDRVPRVLWKGRDWSQFRHPARVISGLPLKTYRGRKRPSRGVMTRTRLPRHG